MINTSHDTKRWSGLIRDMRPFGESRLPDILDELRTILAADAVWVADPFEVFGGSGDTGDLALVQIANGSDTEICPDGERVLQVSRAAMPTSSGSLVALRSTILDSDEIAWFEAVANAVDLLLLGRERRDPNTGDAAIVLTAAPTDSLTGLITLDPFRELLAAETHEGVVNSSIVAIGVDGTTIVNDTLGHSVGDQVLQTVAARLRTTVRDCDVVSRIRGDIFGVYCPGLGPDLAAEVAGRLQVAVGKPIELADGHLIVTCSAGVVETGFDPDADLMLAQVDVALTTAKRRGAGQVVVYDDQLRESTEFRRELANDLQIGLAENQITTGLDPIVSLPDRELVGRRARIRWVHPEHGEIDRNEFMRLVESIGRVSDLERAVVEFALAEQQRTESAETKIAVNLSAASLRDTHQIGWIEEAATREGVDPSGLIVEVTEEALEAVGAPGRSHLQKLSDAGIGIVLAEFGRSHGSICTLHSFPFDGVELHQGLLEDVPADRIEAVLGSIYASADVLGFSVIHGGVDTDRQLDRLIRLDKKLGRGGFFVEGRVARHAMATVSAAPSAQAAVDIP